MDKTLITSMTDGQKKQIKRFVEDAADKALVEANLDKDGLQKLIENGDELQKDIVASIKRHSISNQFVDEEVESSYGYLSGYKPKSVIEQTNILRQLFPGISLSVDEKLTEQPLPIGAEGRFAIPRWEKLASTYGEAVEKVLDMIKRNRKGKLSNYCEGQLGPQHLRRHERTAKRFEMIAEQQKDCDILVVVAQFGLRHRGRSVRRAREVFSANEFGLGAFEIGCMLLTHPERLQHYDDLWIDCPGDKYRFEAPGCFGSAPYFSFDDGSVSFSADRVDDAYASCGSASALWQ